MSSDQLPAEAPPRVFVSYAHESSEHRDHVLRFASFLRTQGIEAVLDTWSEDERQDWYAWALQELTGADYVVVVASARYRLVGDGSGPTGLHRGVQSEAALLRELVYEDRHVWQPKILPVVLDGHGRDEIPRFLQPFSGRHFVVKELTLAGADDLLRVILRRPAHTPPPVATDRPSLPPAEVTAPRGRRFARRRTAWVAGGAVVVVAAVLAVWAGGLGEAGSTAGAPLSVVSMESRTKDYALPGALTTVDDRAAVLDPVADPADFRRMLARNAAAAVEDLTVRLVVEGGRDMVRITDIVIRIRQASPIAAGTYLASIDAGESGTIPVTADLDAAEPLFVQRDPPHTPYFATKQIDLRLGERETLEMTFSAAKKSYAFDLVIHFVADGTDHEQVVSSPSFRVTGRHADSHRYGAVFFREPGEGFRTGGPEQVCDLFTETPGCP